mgnify:CR=1 FL=1|jgi:hypothetical protein|tara:strand:- start:36 stop:242 length:207 start_codon:yes stop_codon:yes gene_type:complete
MRLLIIFLFALTYAQNSYAYFDPGTGAFIVQAIIAFFAAIAFYLGYPIRLIKSFYQKIKLKLSKKNKN